MQEFSRVCVFKRGPHDGLICAMSDVAAALRRDNGGVLLADFGSAVYGVTNRRDHVFEFELMFHCEPTPAAKA